MLKIVKRLNMFMAACIVFLSLYIGLAPLFPEAKFYINKYLSQKKTLPPIIKNAQEITIENSIGSNADISKQENLEKNENKQTGNIIHIPSIDLDAPIQELEKIEDLHIGTWRRPNASTPELGGNTVIVAHRYTSIGGRSENTFYNLPKVEIGEDIFVDYKNKRYGYTVYDVQVVEPDAEWVEEASSTDMLTLYTCTPLWTSTHRHVILSKLSSIDGLKTNTVPRKKEDSLDKNKIKIENTKKKEGNLEENKKVLEKIN